MTSKSAQNRMILGVVTLCCGQQIALFLYAKHLDTLEDDFLRIKVGVYHKRYNGVYLTSRIKMLFQKDRVCTFCKSRIMQKPDTWMELLIELWEFIETFMNSWCSVIVASSTSARIAIEHVSLREPPLQVFFSDIVCFHRFYLVLQFQNALADKFSSGIFVSDVESICELPSVHQQTWNTKFSRLNFAPIGTFHVRVAGCSCFWRCIRIWAIHIIFITGQAIVWNVLFRSRNWIIPTKEVLRYLAWDGRVERTCGWFEKVASAMKSSMVLDFADNVHVAQFLKRDSWPVDRWWMRRRFRRLVIAAIIMQILCLRLTG